MSFPCVYCIDVEPLMDLSHETLSDIQTKARPLRRHSGCPPGSLRTEGKGLKRPPFPRPPSRLRHGPACASLRIQKKSLSIPITPRHKQNPASLRSDPADPL